MVRRMALRALAGLVALVAVTMGLGAVLGVRSWAFALCEIAAIAVIVRGDRRITPILDRRIRGNQGEQHVGAILDALREHGWRILHDVQTERGNIDHIAIGPGGLLTVETKSHGGHRRVAAIEPRWLGQAYAQRKLVEAITGETADCVLVFSRAFLDRPVSRQRGVLVLPARMLAGHLKRRPAIWDNAKVNAIEAQLAMGLGAR